MRHPLVDINVLLDVLGRREPFLADAEQIWTAAETGRIKALVSADSFTILYYLLRQVAGERTARRGLSMVMDVFDIVRVDEAILRLALASRLRDFEDAVQHQARLCGKADCIVTRDLRDYRNADLPVLSPPALLQTMGES